MLKHEMLQRIKALEESIDRLEGSYQLKDKEVKPIEGVEFAFYGGGMHSIINGERDLYNTNAGWMVSRATGKHNVKPAHLVEVKERTAGRIYLLYGMLGGDLEDYAVWDGEVYWVWGVGGGVEEIAENNISHFEVQPI